MYTIHRSLSQLLVLGLYINTLFGDKQRSMFTVLLYEQNNVYSIKMIVTRNYAPPHFSKLQKNEDHS